MQIRNIRPFSQHEPGDVVEVPDGAAFDPFHWEAVEPGTGQQSDAGPAPAQAAADGGQPIVTPPASAPRLPYPAKEM